MWDNIKAWFKHSVTILFARVLTAFGIITGFLLPLLSDPSINEALQSLFKPEHVPYEIIAVGIIVEICRRRTADS